MKKTSDRTPVSHDEAARFGTFQGVFLPSILTVFGVIMYLRMGWVVGNAGLPATLLIVTISSAITFMTALSMSSIATNMKVRGGGAYFMVSRSLGVEAGAAIGLSLFFAKAIGIAFYISGFSESIQHLLPQLPTPLLNLGSLVILTVLASVSANLALKASFVVFLIIIASLISFFMGSPPQDLSAGAPLSTIPAVSFWVVFAVFFPAVTGIETGLSMSGDLRSPARSLPFGSIAAVIVGYLVYMAIPIFLAAMATSEELRKNLMIFQQISRVPLLVLLGIWGATLSSALGSLLGAPRTLQALGRDHIVFPFLGKGHGRDDTPRYATAASFIIAAGALLAGNLNSIAPVLSMFFLTTYGALNLVAGLEGLLSNPSWRPSFRTPWLVSLLGAALCLIAMFMINAGATFIAIFVIVALYYITARRRFNARWQDIRRSIHMALARFSIYRLSESSEEVRTWRPNLLVLSGAPSKRFYLIALADAISHGKGFLTVASILMGEEISSEKIASLEKSILSYLKERQIPALVEVVVAKDRFSGVEHLMKTYGIGPLIPNTVVVGESEQAGEAQDYAKMLMLIYRAKRNLVIVRESQLPERGERHRKHILCWWGGKRINAGLMLAFGYMLQTSEEWRSSRLSIRTIVKGEDERLTTLLSMDEFLREARLIAEPDVLVHPYESSPLTTTIREDSSEADLVLIGMRPPEEDESIESYTAYYQELIERTKGFPMLAIVLAAEPMKFQDIFI